MTTAAICLCRQTQKTTSLGSRSGDPPGYKCPTHPRCDTGRGGSAEAESLAAGGWPTHDRAPPRTSAKNGPCHGVMELLDSKELQERHCGSHCKKD